MPLTPKQKMLVRHTFSKITGKSQEVSQTFYNRLFEIAPELKPLFKDDVKEQGMKLMQMISVVVMSLDKLDTLMPSIEAMGQRHITYGVKKEDYAIVGDALLWALEQFLANEWTFEIQEAWGEVYQLMSDTATSATYSNLNI
jgi:hemoglobin-like flavoprotein